MKRSDERVVDLVLDEGGPLIIWREEDSQLRRSGLFVTALICDNPDCECRDVRLQAVLIDERYTNIENDGKSFKYTFVPRAGESAEPPPLRSLGASFNVDSGQVVFNSAASAEHHDPELLAQLREGLGPHHLERLNKRWRMVKGVDVDGWRRRDWTWWKPGGLVSWLEVYPNDFNLIFEMDGAVYWADDMYCINPECDCKKVGLAYHRVSSEGVEFVGAIDVAMPSWKYSSLMGEGGDEKLLRRLCSAMRRRQGLCATLKDRMQRIKPVGQEIVRLSGAKNSTKSAVGLQTGRNDPCPCGSGKKFKKCCLGRS
ncbi:MAG: SEC-C metal-binding domain-containing protein [Syntrophobacteraceae bacterium]|nr:SEC-C metal-binding domain-containing protein [Syntrophobacteraceae bacterium]